MGKKGNKSIAQLIENQKKALANGNTKRANRISERIAKKAAKNPEQAMPAGQYYAQQEFQQNLAANRPDQYTIGGSQTYTTDPNTGQVTVNQSLSPEQQQLYDQQVGQTSAANQAFMSAFNSGIPYGQAYDFSGAPGAPSTQDLGAQRDEFEGQMYDRNMVQINKTFDQRRDQMMQRLHDTGNPQGTPGYDQAMKQFDDEFRAAESGARSDALSQAGQEFERSFNIGQQGRQSYIGEQVLGRTQPMNELGQLAQFGGGPTTQPNFFGFQPIQYQGPQYLDYLQTGIDQSLGWGAINKPTGGGGGGAPPGPSFSFGGSAPGGIPNIPNAPNPVSSGFASGFQGGVGLGVALS